ncbi:MAG: hypothetical protein JW774_03565 [Candidatus Aureabacteria bacterium]|nr:hypothetical protein [Candidatus Auribacterota bacterium]
MRILAFSLLYLLFLFSPLTGQAEVISVQVDVILAQNSPGGVDPQIRNVQSKLTKVFNFSSYRLISRETVPVNINKKSVVSLPEGGILSLMLTAQNNDQAVIQAEIQKGISSLLNTQFRLKKGGTIILNGPSTSEGVTLVGVSMA